MMKRALTFDDVLLEPMYNGIHSRKAVDTSAILGRFSFKIPIVSANMDTITEHKMVELMSDQGGLGILHRYMSIDQNVSEARLAGAGLRTIGASVGISENEFQRAEALIDAGVDIICVDVAHGHSKVVKQQIQRIREKYKNNVCIIAGNVATYAGADYLASCGADVIKVGIGPGSVCTTRIQTGFGVPQLTAIMDCQRIDRQMIADGGIRYPGDMVKALAAGADMVMIGSLFAGYYETPGIVYDGKKNYRGMASREAQDDFMGGMPEYKAAEGIAVKVKENGSAKAVINNLLGGLRSGLTYCGASNIKELQKKAQFIEITTNGMRESHAHKAL